MRKMFFLILFGLLSQKAFSESAEASSEKTQYGFLNSFLSTKSSIAVGSSMRAQNKGEGLSHLKDIFVLIENKDSNYELFLSARSRSGLNAKQEGLVIEVLPRATYSFGSKNLSLYSGIGLGVGVYPKHLTDLNRVLSLGGGIFTGLKAGGSSFGALVEFGLAKLMFFPFLDMNTAGPELSDLGEFFPPFVSFGFYRNF